MTGRKVFDQMVAFLKTMEGKTMSKKENRVVCNYSIEPRKGQLTKRVLDSNLSAMLGL